ncbi:enhanced ethylene response protein 5 [Tanacetum coccineum]
MIPLISHNSIEGRYTTLYTKLVLWECVENGRGKGPKRIGALYVTCQLFKVYFKLGTVHLCRSVIRSIETASIFDFEEFPVRDKADHKLAYALTHCDPRSKANIRMILKYLVPVKLSIGILPKRSLLEKHNLPEKDPSKANQIKLEVIVKALKWLEMEIDLDEVECIMSILIYKNLVKGYFAHKSKVSVLSKPDPFPKLKWQANQLVAREPYDIIIPPPVLISTSSCTVHRVQGIKDQARCL